MTTPGCDFITEITRNKVYQKINIEVNTPLENDDESKTTIDLGTTTEQLSNTTTMTIRMTEKAPFGLPDRPGKDSVSSEVISKINRIKEDEFRRRLSRL